MNFSQKTSEALDLLVGKAFDLNRSFDRAVSIMQNKWCMPHASDIIHHNLAHLFPLLADIISGFKDSWNVPTVYPETHKFPGAKFKKFFTYEQAEAYVNGVKL